MPVTVRAANVIPKPLTTLPASKSAEQLLEIACTQEYEDEFASLIDSSFDNLDGIQGARNGLVHAALDAYIQHNHLVLRPEDLWFSILVQFSFYVNKHAEEMRHLFVNHAGKKQLRVVLDALDVGLFAKKMSDLIANNVKDPSLREWIMPNFTTTTDTDRIIATILMMGTMKKYFAFFMGITCGIPTVTLLGEKWDWEDILQRLEFLKTFTEHEELQIWYNVLRAIVLHFVQTFEDPTSPEVSSFWNKTVHYHDQHYFGAKDITGWITGLCFWKPNGDPLMADHFLQYRLNWRDETGRDPNRFLNVLAQARLEWDDVPSAYAQVPLDLDNNGEKFKASMIAGSVGWRVRDSRDVFAFSTFPVTKSYTCTRPNYDDNLLDRFLDTICGFFGRSVDDSAKKARAAVAASSPAKSIDEEEPGKAHEVMEPAPASDPPRGTRDTLQPVSGWWLFRSKTGTFGRDEDVPEVQFDKDADDYDEDLAMNGRPLGEL